MLNQTINIIKEKLNNKKVVLACSTGIDSMVLMDLILKNANNCHLIISHVNHKKRKQSEEEEQYIKEYCIKNNIKCYIKQLGKCDKDNFQEWARNERYIFFDEIMELEKADYLLTAHHADDNLETIIMRLIKSSSLKGYAGIELETKRKNYTILRPLLKNSKSEINEYAKINDIFYYQDESNFSDNYTRNRIRKYITPILVEENHNLYEAIEYFSQTLLDANQLLEKEKLSFINNHISVKTNNNEEIIEFFIKDFIKLTPYLQVQILFRILRKYNLSRACIDDIIKQINSSKHKIITNINNNLSMIKEYGYIQFVNFSLEEESYYLEIKNEGEYQIKEDIKILVNKNSCYFITSNGKMWYNIKGLPITIRTRKNGDKIKTKMGTISISDYLTNKKVPFLKRKNILLLCEFDTITSILGYVIK